MRDTILFDINETVLDLAPLQGHFASVFGDASLGAEWFARLLHSSCVAAITEVESHFAELAGIMLDALAARQGVVLSSEARGQIFGAFASLQPHADVIGALEHLMAHGYRCVAFTNSSLDLVQRQFAASGLDVYFDRIISVEPTGCFKPHAKTYHYAAAELARPISTLRLIAAHDWDTHGALSAGMLGAYLNRQGAPYHPLYRQPDVLSDDMLALTEAVVALDKTST